MHHVHHDLKVYGGIKLFSGTGSPDLAQNIAEYLGLPLSDREVIEFPNEMTGNVDSAGVLTGSF